LARIAELFGEPTIFVAELLVFDPQPLNFLVTAPAAASHFKTRGGQIDEETRNKKSDSERSQKWQKSL
jgi:hypothetical protein